MSIIIEFHEVPFGPHQADIFQATIPVHFGEPFALAFEQVHSMRHPGHGGSGSGFDYQYIVERPGGRLTVIPPDMSPADLGLPQGPGNKVWVITRGD
ncbi:hypothetical protein I302_106781 [Kwoniella bestiolae CBS 10118]|uniref:Uncharacterized protein n=1 Tax=Kwoniella bestiolae CBS 10118 TaxID=1296100 RepID=A0A1B9G0E6_9TREE|nr:hypothetical protein I302_05954 [Kwoniella bestiolae CBS 10118]OCF24494.1 hypothetical protein I302_05954 [Kwoniella bestiolae CBS 10118]